MWDTSVRYTSGGSRLDNDDDDDEDDDDDDDEDDDDDDDNDEDDGDYDDDDNDDDVRATTTTTMTTTTRWRQWRRWLYMTIWRRWRVVIVVRFNDDDDDDDDEDDASTTTTTTTMTMTMMMMKMTNALRALGRSSRHFRWVRTACIDTKRPYNVIFFNVRGWQNMSMNSSTVDYWFFFFKPSNPWFTSVLQKLKFTRRHLEKIIKAKKLYNSTLLSSNLTNQKTLEHNQQ